MARLTALRGQDHQASNVIQGAGQAVEAVVWAPFAIVENLATKMTDGARNEGAAGAFKGAFLGATDAPLLAVQAAASGSGRLLHGFKENAKDVAELISPELCEPLPSTDRLRTLLSDCQVSVGQGELKTADGEVYYPVSVIAGTGSWSVPRRYHEFDDLQRRIHDVLVKQGKRELSEQLKQLLPPKSDAGETVAQTVNTVWSAVSGVFGAAPDGANTSHADALEQRSLGLDIYLRAVFQHLGNEEGFAAHSRLSWFLVPEHRNLKHAGPDNVDIMGRCSWCLRRTEHKIKTVNSMARNIYTCAGCERDTLLCWRCCTAGVLPIMSRCCDSGDVGMAKRSYDNCNLCRNKIVAWPRRNVTCKCGCGRTVNPGLTRVRWTVKGDGVGSFVALRSVGTEAAVCDGAHVTNGTACTVLDTTDDEVFTRVRCSQRGGDGETRSSVEGWVLSAYLSCRGGRPWDTCCRECAVAHKRDPKEILAPEKHSPECVESYSAGQDIDSQSEFDRFSTAAVEMVERMISRLSASGPAALAQEDADRQHWTEIGTLEHNLVLAASVVGVWPPRASGPGLAATCAAMVLIAAALKPRRAVSSAAGLTVGAEQVLQGMSQNLKQDLRAAETESAACDVMERTQHALEIEDIVHRMVEEQLRAHGVDVAPDACGPREVHPELEPAPEPEPEPEPQPELEPEPELEMSSVQKATDSGSARPQISASGSASPTDITRNFMNEMFGSESESE